MPVSKGNVKQAAVEKICEKQCALMQYELVEAAFERENTGVYLRIYLDKPEGISLDDCEAFHRAVQPMLEDYEYDFLEVCSPGLDRPIKTARDVEKHVGETVEVRFYRPQDGQKCVTGVLTGMDENGYLVEVNGESRAYPQKIVAVMRLVPDMDGIEDVDLS